MSTRDYSKRGWMLWVLEEVCSEVGDAVTAGQVATRAGVSRNTAKKWLEILVRDEHIGTISAYHVNGQLKRGYFTKYACPDCGGYRQDHESCNEERGYGALYQHWMLVCRDCGCTIDSGTIDLQQD